eukprot:TRINITY_DN11158_c0_g1_i2.p1 TRINITY_DN11158_c0_g1~~TRINITY_DN11158_c0_g1_i2.p1  ORF type:complete len:363 (+),score=26.23 TRINITY_DN11158_c0_g1_i2:569-1657(+)
MALLVPLLFYAELVLPPLHLGRMIRIGPLPVLALLLSSGTFILSCIVINAAQGELPPAEGRPWPRFDAAANRPTEIALRFLLLPGELADWGSVTFTLIPWLGYALFGVALGPGFVREPGAARSRCLWLGLGAFLLFIPVRLFTNRVGSYRGFYRGEQIIGLPRWMDFLNVCRYPPDMSFLFLTSGASMLVLYAFHRADEQWDLCDRANVLGQANPPPHEGAPTQRIHTHSSNITITSSIQDSQFGGDVISSYTHTESYTVPEEKPPGLHVAHKRRGVSRIVGILVRPLQVYGRAPLIFYFSHLWFLGLVACFLQMPPSYRSGVPWIGVALIWAVTLILLYPICVQCAAMRANTPLQSRWRII